MTTLWPMGLILAALATKGFYRYLVLFTERNGSNELLDNYLEKFSNRARYSSALIVVGTLWFIAEIATK